MQIKSHQQNNQKIAEVISQEILIHNSEDAITLLGDLYYQQYDCIIVYHHQLSTEFFELKNGMAGEILQKFSNYRMKLAVVGDYSSYSSKSLQDFIRESNKMKQVVFVGKIEEALMSFS